MQSSLPVVGDMRRITYSRLIDDAVVILERKVFGTGKRSHHQYCKATCCQVWGERDQLVEKGHPASSIKSVGPLKDIEVRDGKDLRRLIVGDEPALKSEPWPVQYPRTVVECTLVQGDEEKDPLEEMMEHMRLRFETDDVMLNKREGLNTSFNLDEATSTQGRLP